MKQGLSDSRSSTVRFREFVVTFLEAKRPLTFGVGFCNGFERGFLGESREKYRGLQVLRFRIQMRSIRMATLICAHFLKIIGLAMKGIIT